MRRIVIGTRGSRLALYQTELVRSALEHHYPELDVAVEIIKTTGDKRLDLALDASGDKGLFTKELELALLSERIDIAVHSLKDLPVEMPRGIMLGAILEREASEDALLGEYTLETLPHAAIVGTSSRRRAEQLRCLRPDLEFRPIRGNVETRIEKMRSGQYHAIVMALAGIRRLELEEHISQILPMEQMVSAPGQAAIAVQQLSKRTDLVQLLEPLNCARTAREVTLERRILSRLGGGCALPLGVRCKYTDTTVELYAFYKPSNSAAPIYKHISASPGQERDLEEQMLHALIPTSI